MRASARAGCLLAGAILCLGVCRDAAPARTAQRVYEVLGVRFSLSLELMPAKVLRLGCADYMWPAMGDPQLGLILRRVPRSEEEPASVLVRQRNLLFGVSGSARPWRTWPLLGKPVPVERLIVAPASRGSLDSCLVPLGRDWLFVGLHADGRVSSGLVERTWSEMSRSLQLARSRR